VTPRRRATIAEQYESEQSATEYARAYQDEGAEGRFFRLRVEVLLDLLSSIPRGTLLDVGCGPGGLELALFERRGEDFTVSVLDQSRAMVEQCRRALQGVHRVRPTVARLEAMPFADDSFDVVVAAGVLEYVDLDAALAELARVTTRGGRALVTMLNPVSPYRLTDWLVWQPTLRVIGTVERRLPGTGHQRHGRAPPGVHVVPAWRLERSMRRAGLEPVEVVYFDATVLVPPFDRIGPVARYIPLAPYRRAARQGWRRALGTAYVIAATPVDRAPGA